MPFSDLDDMRLQDFADRERQHAEFWLFMHIPKTAGSSFSEAMQKHVAPYANIQVDYTDSSRSHNQKLSDAVDNFLDDYKISRKRSASGHIPYDLVENIKSTIPNTKVVTFFRDPVSRVVSDYRYQRTPLHPPNEVFRERFPTIESYIESPESQNKMARFIGGRGVSLIKEELLHRIDHQFSFVGLLEMYPLSYNIIFNLFGMAGQFPHIHSRRTPDTGETRVKVTEETIRSIKDKNDLDCLLYERVKERLLRVKSEWALSLQEKNAGY